MPGVCRGDLVPTREGGRGALCLKVDGQVHSHRVTPRHTSVHRERAAFAIGLRGNLSPLLLLLVLVLSLLVLLTMLLLLMSLLLLLLLQLLLL